MALNCLIYTVAYDNDGSNLYGTLAKLLASSILRSGHEHRIVIFHNGEERLFRIARSQVFEERIHLEDHEGFISAENISTVPEQRWSLKHRVAPVLLTEFEWDRLLFIDADCLVTGPLDGIINGDYELAVYREPGQPITQYNFNCFLTEEEMQTLTVDGINSGIFCVDRSIAGDFFQAWGEAERQLSPRARSCTDQAAFNRVVLDRGYKLHDFSHLVSMPFHTDKSRRSAVNSCVTHWIGTAGERKAQVSFGLFMETYFFDPKLSVFHLLEA